MNDEPKKDSPQHEAHTSHGLTGHEEHHPSHSSHEEHHASHSGHEEHPASHAGREEHRASHSGHEEHGASHAGHGGHPASHTGHEAPAHTEHARHPAHPAEPGPASGHVGHGPAAPGRPGDSGHAGHVDHTGHEQLFRKRFWISLVLTIPVILYTPMIQEWSGLRPPAIPGAEWIAPVFSVAIFAVGGLPFLRMAWPELANRQPGMMTLVSLAISVAFVYSLAALFIAPETGFFWELATLIDIMLLGHWVEMRSVRQASGALNELARLMPDTADRLRPDGSVEVVPATELAEGEVVLVRPGSSVPADGEVIEGSSEVNEAMLTGESRPVPKEAGARVIAGTINGDGSLRVRVTATGEGTALAGIMRLVAEAQRSKSRTQVLADRAAGWLFYAALGVAAITAVAWIVAAGFSVEVVERVATVLVIACPHALGLAVPLVVAITTSLGASQGILVRNRMAMEAARAIDVVMFDKTGTLTKGEFGVVGISTSDGYKEDEALALAAAVEGDSEHSIAQGIRRSAEAKNLKVPTVSGFEALKGRGVRAQLDGKEVHLGGPRLLEMLGVEPAGELARFAEEAGRKGQSVVFLITGRTPVAALAVADVIRPESREAVRVLHEMGVEVAMLTGDSQEVARAVAEELGIDRYFAEVLPEHKDRKVIELQKMGKRVAMVGDGVNDAPALTRADVGIAIGSGTDVAVESAGIILVRSNPLDIVKIIRLSRASYRKMIQNLVWATGYNVFALPLAAGILAPWGILLSPAMGAVLMSLSTVIVALNAQLLRRAG